MPQNGYIGIYIDIIIQWVKGRRGWCPQTSVSYGSALGVCRPITVILKPHVSLLLYIMVI